MVKKKTVTREDKIKDYKASDIQALTPLQHLRRRLNLTFGDERGCDEYPFSSQQNVAVREIWDNALGEIAIGVANRLRVTFYQSGAIKIEDNGRGIPTDISEDAYGNKVSGIFKALGLLQSGSALKGVQKGKFTTSQNGVGGSSTNGVSEWFKVRVFKNKKIYALDFLDYVPGLFDDKGVFKHAKDNSEIYTLKDNRSKEDKELFAHGSSVEFKLNDKWFIVPYSFDKDDIVARIRGAAYLYPHTTMEILDEQEDGSFEKQIFNSEEGIKELVDIQVGNNITKIIDFSGATAFREKGQGQNNPNIPKSATGETLLEYIDKEYNDGDLLNDERELYYSLAFNYNSGYDYVIDTYCNDIRTTLGGVHVQALEKALTDAFNTKFRSMKNGLNKNDNDVIVKDVEEGLTAVLSIKTNVPRFVGQEKQLLGGKELQKALYDSIYSQLIEWLNKGSNRDDVEIIAKKVITAMKNRTRIQEQQELNREKNKVMRDSSMPVKLVDCEITHAPISEIFISEGDSALGGLKAIRDSRYQALFPIRGKILNVLKASPKDIMQNQETQDIIKCLDCGLGEDFDIEKMRYHNVIMACFTGDTKVKSLDGNSYSFKELVDNNIKELWTYSIDKNGNVVPSLAKNISKIKEVNQLVKITLDNGEAIKSTLDHKFMLPDLSYEKAQNLKVGQSLMPIYTKIYDKHEMYFDRNSGKYKYTHELVGNTVLSNEKEEALNRLQNEEHSPNQNGVCVHHKDVFNENNSLNNTPENLEWLTSKEHFIEHSNMNKTEEGREYYRSLHEDGKLKNWSETYNGSEKHLADIEKARQLGKYKECSYFIKYNKTQANIDSCKKSNSNPLHILHSKQTKALRTIKYLIENDLEVNEENYNYNKCQGAVLFSKLNTLFTNLDEAIKLSKNVDISNYSLKREQIPDAETGKRTRVAGIIKRLVDKGLELNEENYNSVRVKEDKDPVFETILKVYDSYEDAYEAGKHYNHKIVNIEFIDVENEPVYCMEISNYHNFLLDSGVVVHNCDADTDGSAIANLLITWFWVLMPEVIKQGRLFRMLSPLYEIIVSKDEVYYCVNSQEKEDIENKLKKENKEIKKINRFKGLGETDPDVLFEVGMNPETRRIAQITIEDVEKAEEIINLISGDDADARKEWIIDNPYTPEVVEFNEEVE